MLSRRRQDCFNICQGLKSLSNLAEFRVQETEKTNREEKELLEKLQIIHKNITTAKQGALFAKEVKKDLIDYNADKKAQGLNSIYSGIYSATKVIADSTPVKLEVTKEEACLVNAHGNDVNLADGSAFRATLSFFLRSVVLRNTKYNQLLILDEPLTTLSTESSAQLSSHLPLLAKDIQIILIEQKDEIFSNIDSIVYDVRKTDGVTNYVKVTFDD